MIETNTFLEELPYKQKIDLSMRIQKKKYKNIEFFQNKSPAFIAWVFPLMKPLVKTESEMVYMEGD